MEIQKERKTKKHLDRTGILIAGLIFIALGMLILMHNLGAIYTWLYRILLSWQMLLVVLGLWAICRRRFVGGIALAGTGAFFMIPLLTPVGHGWMATYWPFIFIILGVIVLARLFRPSGHCRGCGSHRMAVTDAKDGFVEVDNSFGAVRHIVLDPVFNGARVHTRYSGTILDLKRTTLVEGKTYIDLDMVLSGLELYVPDGWTVVVEAAVSMAGIDDQRYSSGAPDNSCKLVIRGNISLSGVVIKS